MLGHWSLSFQYSRWSIGFFHRVFVFVRVEQKLESFTSPLYITNPNILCSHFIRVVPSCFCQTVTVSFICGNRGLLLQDLGKKDRSRIQRVDPVRKRCVVQTFHCTGRQPCLSVPDLQVPLSLVRGTASREEPLSTGALLVGPSHLSSAGTLQKGIMVKTCKVKVDKGTHIQVYDNDEYEKLICELSVSAKKGRNAKGRSAFKCIYCTKMFTSKERLNYHRLKGCDRALDINGKPLQLKLYPSVTSGGAVEVRDVLEKNNLHVRNTFKCIHCNKECLSKQRLNYHCRVGCPGVLDIDGQPLQLKLLPSVPSGGAAEFRNISEKHNFHGVCEPEESDLLASFGEDVLHVSPNEMMGCRRCTMADTTKGAKYQGEEVQTLRDQCQTVYDEIFGPDIAAQQETISTCEPLDEVCGWRWVHEELFG